MKEKRTVYFLIALIALISIIQVYAQEGEENGEEQPPMEGEEVIAPPVEEPPKPMGPPPEDIPEGCHSVETGTGMFKVECNVFEEPEFKEDFKDFGVKGEIEECKGKFEMVKGTPVCIKEGKEGFGPVVCPAAEEINQMKSSCNTKIEEFTDEKGCKAVMCVHEEFKERYDQKIDEKYGDDPVKAEAIKCEKDGGHFIFVKDKPRCIMEFNEIQVKEEKIKEMNQEKIKEAKEKMENFQEKIGEIGEKLEKLKEGYKELGETEGIKAAEYGIEKLGKVQLKISTIKSELSSESLSEEEKVEILIDIQELRRDVSKVTKAVATGSVPTIEEIEAEVAKQMDRFYGSPFGSEEEFQKWVEAEKDAIEIIRGCDKYSAENVKSFVPPDPEGFVVKVDLYLEGTECIMTLHTKEGKKATYPVPEEDYKKFKAPKVFVNFSCTGDCDALNKIFTMHHGSGSPEELCMEECIQKDCDDSMFVCMEKNMEKCEEECGLRGDGQGPFVDGELDPFQGCVMVCAGDRRCEPGGNDSVCIACEEKCMNEYGPGIGYEHCLTEEQLDAKEQQCMQNNQYGEMVESSIPEGGMCISDVICKDFDPSEWGDNPQGGPPPGYEGDYYGPPTGGVILPEDVLSAVTEWLKRFLK